MASIFQSFTKINVLPAIKPALAAGLNIVTLLTASSSLPPSSLYTRLSPHLSLMLPLFSSFLTSGSRVVVFSLPSLTFALVWIARTSDSFLGCIVFLGLAAHTGGSGEGGGERDRSGRHSSLQ